jgi:glycosyltransferase involved in cell wall biosynthesis
MVHGPLISICVPTYNASRYIEQTMATVLYQDYENREIIIVDDASQDDTWERLQKYSSVPGIRLFRNQSNLGIGGNWNRCLELAEGEYVKYVHCDDICYPDCVSTLVAEAARFPEAALLFASRHFLLDEMSPTTVNLRFVRFLLSIGERQKAITPGMNHGRDVLNVLFPGCQNIVGEPTATLIRTRALSDLGGFDERFRQLIDIEAWVRLLLVHGAVFIPRALCQWRVHERQASSLQAAEGIVLPELCRLYLKHREALKSSLDATTFRRFSWSIWINLLLRKREYAGRLLGEEYSTARAASYVDQGGIGGAIRTTVGRLTEAIR